jgi:hypothetical protein
MADTALARCVATLSAVFIFGGDIMRAENQENLGGLGWRSLKGLETDKTGPMPSYERVLAGECLHRMNPSLLLIPSGGKTNLEGAGASPLIATVMAAELRELGVPPGAIIEETESFATLQPGQYEPIDPFVLGVTPLMSVERVLASNDPAKWNAYFDNLYDNPAMAQTLVQETVGVGQLWAGHAPKFGAPYRGFLDPLEDR